MVIRESFIQLYAKKPISQITVKEICERSGINRSTFYRNYIDVYDVKEQIENEFLLLFHEFMQGKRTENAEESIRKILQLMKENQKRYIALHKIPSEKMLTLSMDESFKDGKQYYQQQAPHMTETELRWYHGYICGGCATVMLEWVKNGMKEPPEELARFLARFVMQNSAVLKGR